MIYRQKQGIVQMILRYCGIVFSFFVLVQPITARAAMVQPTLFETSVVPGAVARGEIVLTNDSDGTASYSVVVQKFVAENEDGQQSFYPTSDASDPVSWIKVSQNVDAVLHGSSARVPFSINVPSSARPGGYTAAIFFSPEHVGSAAASLQTRIGVLVFVNVTGDFRHGVKIASCAASGVSAAVTPFGQSVYETLPQQFVLRVQNTGDDIISPSGNVRIRSVFGQQIADLSFNPSQKHALPHSIRRFFAEWKREVQPPAFGRYTAACSVSAAVGDSSEFSSFSFWVIPWKIILVLLGVILFLILLITRYTRRRRV